MKATCREFLLVGLTGLSLLVFTGIPLTKDSASCGSAVAGTPDSYSIGDLVQFDDSEWIVIDARELGDVLKGDGMFVEDKQTEGKFVYVRFRVTNNTPEQQSILFTPSLLDSKERRFEQLDVLALYLPEAEVSMTMEQLPSGLPKTFSAIFEVPKDADGLTFLARDFAVLGKAEKGIDLGLTRATGAAGVETASEERVPGLEQNAPTEAGDLETASDVRASGLEQSTPTVVSDLEAASDESVSELEQVTPAEALVVETGSEAVGSSQAPDAGVSEVECPGSDKVCRSTKTHLPLRALPRAFSSIYSEPDTGSQVLASNVKAFWPVYVFERQDVDFSDPANPTGWYRVGPMDNDPFGWMQAKDLLEWKQALIVAYKHPGTGDDRRRSVLMFRDMDALAEVVESSEREAKVDALYAGLDTTPVEVPETVVSREPQRFVDIEEKFYMLPVIDFEVLDLFDEEARYLQLAAALPVQEGVDDVRATEGNTDTFENLDFAEDSGGSETREGTDAKDLVFDIKFVMDMTGSMGPYIERTKNAIRKIATEVVRNNPEAQVRFGLVGYRDDLKAAPGLEFAVKDFTPAPVDAATFDSVISQAAPAQVGSADYPEEVFAGMQEGIDGGWSENSLKLLILVGDAPSHPVGHPQNTTGKNAQAIRDWADRIKVNVLAIHLQDPRAQEFQAEAESQFRTLSTNLGAGVARYFPIGTDNQDDFERTVKRVAEDLAEGIAKTRSGDLGSVLGQSGPQPRGSQGGASSVAEAAANEDTPAAASRAAREILAEALVEYLGQAANPPRDITAWVMDKDLSDPDVNALDVRVLIKKKDLNDMIIAMENILKAVKRSQLTGMQFFDALQGVLGDVTLGTGNVSVANAERLAESGLLPSWLESLPYRSALMEMSNRRYESLAPEERANLEYELEAKLALYRELNENADLWVALDERDAPINQVYPLPLSTLP